MKAYRRGRTVMANERKNGAANAAAVWCASNLLSRELSSPQQRTKFKNVLVAVLRQELISYSSSDAYCVLQITDSKPNKLLERVLRQTGLSNKALVLKNIMVLVYHNEVMVDINSQNSYSESNNCQCIYRAHI